MLAKWEPFRDMDDVFNRFFADTVRRLPVQAGNVGEAQPAREWALLNGGEAPMCNV